MRRKIFATIILLMFLSACSMKNEPKELGFERDISMEAQILQSDDNLVFIGETKDKDGTLHSVIGVVDETKKLPNYLLSLNDVIRIKSSPFLFYDEGIKPYNYPIYLPVIMNGQLFWPADGDRKDKFRPAPGGVSVGHIDITAGTLGGRVCSTIYGCSCFITNCHVAGCFDGAKIGDDIIQPGKHDGGKATDSIGKLVVMGKPGSNQNNLVDAALICGTAQTIYPEIYQIGAVNNIETNLYTGMPSQKSGRNGITHFTLLATSVTVKVCYSENKCYTFTDQILFGNNGVSSLPGDSGSFILTDTNPPKLIALLFAGNSDGQTMGNKIENVFRELNVYLPDMRRGIAPYPGPIINP